MTEQPEPIRKSVLPCTPPPEWEFHTWFPHPHGGGDLVPGQHTRGAHVRRRVTYGDWEPVFPDRWAEERPTDAASSAAPSAPADRVAVLREAADRLHEMRMAEREWLPATGLQKGQQELRRMADEAQQTGGQP
ncbi:hypothetical protein [Streptomyces huasconensis]|uniref:hypothetical protein n=1 Tax=Streptomyces huasconensis TaxID=1854574 RepID=UPI0036FC0414